MVKLKGIKRVKGVKGIKGMKPMKGRNWFIRLIGLRGRGKNQKKLTDQINDDY